MYRQFIYSQKIQNMKTQLFKNQYVTYLIEQSTSTIYEIFKPASENMNDHEFMEIMNIYESYFVQYKPLKMFIDAREFLFPVTPTMQEWIEQNVAKIAIENGQKKSAILMSKDILTQMSIEQIMAEGHIKDKVETRYFTSEDDAHRWLALF